MTRFAALVVAALVSNSPFLEMREYPMDWGTGGSPTNEALNEIAIGPVHDFGGQVGIDVSPEAREEMRILYGQVPALGMMPAEHFDYFMSNHDSLISLTNQEPSQENLSLIHDLFFPLFEWLGRSPYIDEVANPDQPVDSGSDDENSPGHPYVQQYDARGHPINLETRHRERMEVQAGNEVLQVAGIVETCTAREERERHEEEEKLYEKYSGLLLNRIGHRVLTAGMWGVSGLRRRVILQELYSGISFFAIVRRERYYYGTDNLITPGLGVQAISHLLGDEWPGLGNYFLKRKNPKSRVFPSWLAVALVKTCGFGLAYARTYLQMFALLKQLNLMVGEKMLPSLRSFIPFSRDSLIQLPAVESTTTKSGSLLSIITTFVLVASPITLVYLYGKALPTISNYLFNPCYALILRPAVRPRSLNTISSWTESLTGRAFLQALKNNGFAPSYMRPDPRELHESRSIRTLLYNTTPAYYDLRDETSTIHRNEALRILEGGRASEEIEIPEEDWDGTATTANDANGNNSEGTQVSWASMISVEVVDHGPRTTANTNPGAANTVASAELHDATNTPPNPRNSLIPKAEEFHVTYLTMLPSILLSHTLSNFLAYTFLIPLEVIMVRSVAYYSYIRYLQPPSLQPYTSLPTIYENISLYKGIYYTGISMPRSGWKKPFVFMANLMAANWLVLGAGVVIWATLARGSVWFRRRRVSRERGPVEIEIRE